MRRKNAEQEEKYLQAVDWKVAASRISQWFQDNQRPLVFRETRDPYHIMVSEFMLQQTTVATVIPYYQRFLESFPNLQALAQADEEAVLTHWAGLGYYRRARQLQQTARVLMEEHGGIFPRDSRLLQQLPGIGRYTSGAILSSAFDLPEPVLEANTIRVYSRLANINGIVGDGLFTSHLWEVGTHLVQAADSPRLLNMGAMELGALVCKSRPECGKCPVQDNCMAFHFDRAEVIPSYPPKREKISLSEISVVLQNENNECLVRRIEAGAWHAGMWEFPTFRIELPAEHDLPVEVCHELDKWLGNSVTAVKRLVDIKYTVTHHRITNTVFHCRVKVKHQEVHPPYTEWKWISPANAANLPMGSAQRKIVKLLEKL